MLRMTLACLLLLAVLASCVYAVDPATDPSEEQKPIRSRREQEIIDEARGRTGTSLPFAKQFISGRVTDAAGMGVRGATVKLFADGELVESDRTSSSGEFELNLPLNIEADETVVLWVVPSTDKYVMQCIVLKRSSAARQAGLFGPCAVEVPMQAQMEVEVSLLTGEELAKSVKARGCY